MKILLLLLSIVFMLPYFLAADESEFSIEAVEAEIRELMEEGDIPGLCLVIVKGGEGQDSQESVYIKGFGYADLEKKIPVAPDTLFELASCSKAFTALAALKLDAEGWIRLDDPVSKYLPWFFVTHEDQEYDITIHQALHQTTGIPWKSISRIPVGNTSDSLQQTVKNMAGMEVEHIPGTHYQYATVNYDIVGAVIEKVSKMTYEDYMDRHIFKPLGLDFTIVGVNRENPPAAMATGYKIGFFAPRRYAPPVYRGNNPAGYIITNGKDMVRWLKLQLGLLDSDFDAFIQRTHSPDLSVRPSEDTLVSYGMGWFIQLYEGGGIAHSGLNPNFTTYIGLKPKDKIAVAVMANSNSRATAFIGDFVTRSLYGQDRETMPEFRAGDTLDKPFSVFLIILGLFLLGIIVFLLSIAVGAVRGKRRLEALTGRKILKLAAAPLLFVPFLLGIYLLPKTLADVSWATALVWSPASFKAAVILLLVTMAAGYIAYFFSVLLPQKNKYLKSLPSLILLSMLSGFANAAVIFLITSAFYPKFKLIYLLYYFALTLGVKIVGYKVVRTRLIRITLDIVYDLRMKLIKKIFLTSYQKFEKIDRGRVFATLNNDTTRIGGAANFMVGLITSVITVIGAFMYLATIAFWATMVTLSVITVIAVLYYFVGQKAREYFEEARDTQNVYMGLLNGLVNGFKELSLHLNKRKQYQDDLENTCDKFRTKAGYAMVRFVNAFLIGETLLMAVLAMVGFAVPRLFPHITTFTLMSFIMVLLYLIGPVNTILGAIPGFIQLRVAWNRIQGFIKDIPANMNPEDLIPLDVKGKVVENIKARGIMFQYRNEGEDKDETEENFAIGPVDFEARKGEIIFIVGGNGSGKTTLAKVLTGMYVPDKGSIEINDCQIKNHQLGEYFSAVFSDYHLFKKLYDVELAEKEKEAHRYLELLEMQDKVGFENNSLTTIDVSGGQKKRLALLQCYLENCPIFLFDELAADQDPVFRRFFYHDLLRRMKEKGKIVIAITHDDHYFNAADRVIKMDMGKIDFIQNGCEYKL